MSVRAKALLGLSFVLAGCATAPRRNTAHVPNWEEPGTTTGALARNSISLPAPASPPDPSSTESNNPIAASVLPAPAIPQVETWVALARWCRSRGLTAPICVSTSPGTTYALRAANGVLDVRVGSLLARWNGLELHLGFAPQLIGGQLFLHNLDLEKTILPLIEPGPFENPGSPRILVIDPGHGGADAGARSVVDSRYEKEFTLDWALRLQRLLASDQWQVFLTRSNDAEMALSNRVSFAENRHANLFLSLHFNSSGSGQGDGGLETYCLTPAGMPSSLTRGYPDETDMIFPNNAFDAENLLLALSIHRALLQVNGHFDRGVRRARFPTVLRGQQCPAILVEGGYLSDPREARLIGTPAYRQKLAEAVARALGASPRPDTAETGGR